MRSGREAQLRRAALRPRKGKMAKSNCIIVRAAGRNSDILRLEASNIAKSSKVDWWVERTDKGTCFFFEDLSSKKQFAAFCEKIGVPHAEG